MSESLYGGKRISVVVKEQAGPQQRRILHLQPMSKHHGIRLALLLALEPYLEEQSDSIGKALERQFKNLPLMRMTSKATFWVYQWRHLLGWLVFFDPYSPALNLMVRRVTQEDQQQQKLEQKGHHHQQQQLQSTTSVAGLNREGHDGNKPQQGFTNIVLWLMKDMLQGKSPLMHRVAAGVVSLLIALSFLARVQGEQQEMQQEGKEREEQRRQQQESAHEFPGCTTHKKTKSVPPPPLPPTPRTSEGRARDDDDDNNSQLTSAFHNLTTVSRAPRQSYGIHQWLHILLQVYP